LGVPSSLAQVCTDGATFRFAVTDRKAGRAPELESPATLEWIGRFIGRMHIVGARKPFDCRRALTMQEFGWGCRDWLIEHGDIPALVQADWKAAVDAALRQLRTLRMARQTMDRPGVSAELSVVRLRCLLAADHPATAAAELGRLNGLTQKIHAKPPE
jgi:hypothetical protein